jgi:hypothetical protein
VISAVERREFLKMSKPRTLYDKIWDDHLIEEADGA